ncbi:MAG: RHS repeat-associated core domain-containing protein [Phycisphaeraceae bacterium]
MARFLNICTHPLFFPEHDAFGKTNFLNADFTAKGTQQSGYGLRYAYTGRELDILDSGNFTIMNFRGRYYDPATGTFYQRDPAGYPDGLNAYAGYFAMWGRMDPLGLWGWLDWVQTTLDVVGFIPVIGTAADVVNAGISAARGNLAEAGINLVAAVPIVGDGIKGVKMAVKATDATVTAAKGVGKIAAEKAVKETAEHADDVAKACPTAVKGTGAKFADNAKLDDHFQRHGADFGAKTAAEYQGKADTFLTGSRGQGVLEKVRPNGDVIRYNPATEEFGVVSKNGAIRTYYRPDPKVHGKPSNLDYFNGQ